MSIARAPSLQVRDFSALCPHTRPHPWRSVRRRQRRMYESRRYYNIPVYTTDNDPTLAAEVTNAEDPPTPNPPCTVDCAIQTDPLPQPSYHATATQTLSEPICVNTGTQTTPPFNPTSVEVPTSVNRPPEQQWHRPFPADVPVDDIWRAGPSHSYWRGLQPHHLLDPPLRPIPPLPKPPREYTTVHVSEERGHWVNIQKPPAQPPPRATYSLAETTAEVLSIVSQHYPSILHAQFDYFRLPPFQRRAILDLHRLLFPDGIRKWRSGSRLGLLPMRFIQSYFCTWQDLMGQVVQDSGAEQDYIIIDGIFVR